MIVKRIPAAEGGVPLHPAYMAGVLVHDSLMPVEGVGRVTLAGSVRRHRPTVNDLDLVVLTDDSFGVDQEIQKALRKFQTSPTPAGKKALNGRRYKRFWGDYRVAADLEVQTLQTDVFITDQESQWATLLLVKTGSEAHNIKLATRAQAKGWMLKANGDGLIDGRGARLAWRSEEEILRMLDCDHFDPTTREG